MAHIATQEAENRRITVRNQPWKIVHKTLSQKQQHKKKAGRVPQVVEHPPSNCKALSWNSSATKKTYSLIMLPGNVKTLRKRYVTNA
jgi:hypothetical protein